MKRNRVIIIGIGKIGADLLQKLSKDYDLLCIDNSPESAEHARKLRGDGSVCMQADATSRLVLDEANVNEAECVIITTTSEPVNIEICRLLKEHFRPKRVIAVGTSSEGIKALTELGAEVQDLFAVSAAGIRNLLEQRARAATAIGLGKNEILEVELHPHSRLANKRIGNLAPIRWKIGIVYRDGNIVVPKSDTVLKPRDRVVILGDPGVLKTVAEIMTFRFQKFPQEYGSTGMVYLAGFEDEAFFAEVEYVFSVFALQRVLFLQSGRAAGQAHRYEKLIRKEHYPAVETRHIDLPPDDAAARLLRTEELECGIFILHGGMLQRRLVSGVSKQQVLRLCGLASCPVLIARGTHPYGHAAVPVAEGMPPHHALETALEAASSLNNEVSALLVPPMRHIASEDDLREFESYRKSIAELSLMYRADVRNVALEGNPVRAVAEAVKDQNLLYIDASGIRRGAWPLAVLNPDPAWQLIRRSTVSTLLVPPLEEAL